ncbi:hypothetical protein LF817_16370 [Halobacillus sp. A1]|uniref:hypothetical protein n=1 Tax=Halobacillus sp. A1 TaxID=2880262 RepID=UPI0020A6CDB8|nr:hypothetical protein [Halobacillus sp. A1]MCP3032901.1 hypothetical protein [Halobacillus sp. A1]
MMKNFLKDSRTFLLFALVLIGLLAFKQTDVQPVEERTIIEHFDSEESVYMKEEILIQN